MSFDLDWGQNGLFEIPNATGTPERRLILAVLERSILDFVGNDPEEYISAETWIFEHEGNIEKHTDDKTIEHAEFSFPWVCQQLDIDYIKTAQKIKAMPKRGKQRVAPWYFSKQTVSAASQVMERELERISA